MTQCKYIGSSVYNLLDPCDCSYCPLPGMDFVKVAPIRDDALHSSATAAQNSSNTLHSCNRDDDTQPFYTSQEKFDQLHVDDTDTKPRRVDSGLFPKHDLADKMQADATKRESTAEAKCPKCNGDVYYHGMIRVECVEPSCENYRFAK